MELYCVKERRNTPNVQGSEKVVEKVVNTKKNSRKLLLLLKAKCFSCGITKTSFMPENVEGSGVDIHAAIGKFPKPKKGWTLPGHNFTGPYNPLEKQVKFNPETGEILEIYQPPTGATDAIAMQHDIDCDVCSNREKKYGENLKKCKHKADKKMVKSLDAVPYKQRQWGHAAARNAINTKPKLGLGLKKQKGTGFKPWEVAKYAEKVTKKLFLQQNLFSIGIGQVILRKMLSRDQLVSQARNFGLIRKRVLLCVW